MFLSNEWEDYELIDAGGGEKVERWGEYILRRPDPQAIWPAEKQTKIWENIHAHYHRSSKGGGEWQYKKKIPKTWTIKYKELNFIIEPTSFKHTGLFPEQAVNWEWLIKKIQTSNRKIKVLNLFAYTGGASVACSFAGADVCHVDASKGMVLRAKENIHKSNLQDNIVRFITDDVNKFVEREIRRGNKYDGIIMDPPSYGRGPSGEMWKLEDELFSLISNCTKILSSSPLFFLVNSYTTGLSPYVVKNILDITINAKNTGKVSCNEIGIPLSSRKLILPCGATGVWES